MLHRRSSLLLLSLILTGSTVWAELPREHVIQGIARVKQAKNYCGPACVAPVMQYFGSNVTQETIGKAIYDEAGGATHGGDMLLYAREYGFAAYSWNTSISDVKRFIAAGLPVIALQQNSTEDTSGHYRVLTGYDDARSIFHIIDPYYETTEQSYADAERLWNKMGYWALLIVPREKDIYRQELDEQNPVVHMDLAYANLRRKDYKLALAEAQIALALQPRNSYALALVDKINKAMGAGAK